MSRSIKHSNFHKVTGTRSEKQDKQLANRKWRRNEKQALHNCKDFDNFAPIHKRENSNVYSFDGDGKAYWADMNDPKYTGYYSIWREKWIEADPLYKRIGK